MSKEGKKNIVKNAGTKKINHYSQEQCQKEIERMERAVTESNKTGNQSNSKYYREVKKQLKMFIDAENNKIRKTKPQLNK